MKYMAIILFIKIYNLTDLKFIKGANMNNLEKFREAMEKENIDYYIIPSSDSHQSEYVAEHFKEENLYQVLQDQQEYFWLV